jgi:hypothetical protein
MIELFLKTEDLIEGVGLHLAGTVVDVIRYEKRREVVLRLSNWCHVIARLRGTGVGLCGLVMKLSGQVSTA